MKLIMENWRNYLEQPKTTSYLIYERGGQLQRVDFNNLLLELDNGKTTQQQAYLMFEQAFDYGMQQLLEEGVIDLLKKLPGVEKVGKLAGQAKEKVKAAWNKVNDFYMDMVLKAIKLAADGTAAFVKYGNKIFSSIEKFKKKHPIFYKIIVGIIFALIIYSVFGSSNAQAAVKVGDVTLSDFTYQAVQGALNGVGSDPDMAITVGKAQVAFERAHQAGEAVNIKDLGPLVNSALEVVVEEMGKAKAGGSESIELIDYWTKIGRSLKFQATGF